MTGQRQNTALRFLCEYLLQTVAFRRRDPRIIDSAPEISEIADLAVPGDGYWIDRLVETYGGDGGACDDRSFSRNSLSAPFRAAANGVRSIVLIDNLHAADDLDGGDAFFDDLREIFRRSAIPFVLAGRRRAIFARTPFATLPLEAFSFSEAAGFVEHLSKNSGVEINDQTRDLIAVQLGGNAGHITALFASAAAKGSELNSFDRVEQVFTDEIFGGRIGRFFDNVFYGIAADARVQSKILWLLTETISARGSRVPLSYWRRHAGLAGDDLARVLMALHTNEIINAGSGPVEVDTANTTLCDYIAARRRIEIDGETRGLAVGETLTENIKRAPKLMARYYRRTSAIGLRGLLGALDGRRVSTALVDYARFKSEFKGADDDDRILKSLKEDNLVVDLPQIIYTANTSAFYPKLNELCDSERSVIGLGFHHNAGSEETALIAVQIDSKLEAKQDVAEFWCDRLEMAAVNSDFVNYKLWLIAAEGFDADALAVLRERGVFASSRKQIELLAAMLDADISPVTPTGADDYEIVFPMGEDTEIIAAHTIDEIAKRHNFPAKTINQIKTALVEACINATEHSLSPDRRIHQKFSVETDKITITISNRGVRLADAQTSEKAADETRRGWGLKLMKGLMDEVNIEKADDGTRITMVKYLKHVAAASPSFSDKIPKS